MNTRLSKLLVATGAVVAVLAPVASATATAAQPQSSSPAARVAQCTNGDLLATYRERDAAAGHRYGVLRLTNVSDTACRTGGYGGLSYVGHGDGTQIGAAADRTKATVRTVVLQPGDTARSRVSEAVAQNYPKKACRPTPVDGFRVYVPNATRSQYVAHPTTGCARSSVHLLSHRPLR